MNNQDSNLNALFNRYWQDYQQNRPIGGGVAYESKLRQCTLDGSLDSLKELDILLTAIRKDVHVKFVQSGKNYSNKEKQSILLKQDEFYRLVLFIGLYTGVVLAKVYKFTPQFINQSQLQQLVPQLEPQLASDDVTHSMAVNYIDSDKHHYLNNTQVASLDRPWLFFVFEPIMMRLFGAFDYQIQSIQGQTQVADGLYRAVTERLPEAIVEQINATQHHKPVVTSQQRQPEAPIHTPLQTSAQIQPKTPVEITQKTQPLKQEQANKLQPQTVIKSPPIEPVTEQVTPNVTVPSPVISSEQSKTKQTKGGDSKDEYLQLLVELESIPVEQSQAVEQYQKAKSVMQKLDNFAQQQGKAPSEIQLNESQTKVCQQALQMIKKSASVGNTTAMLHLAVYLMRGDWLAQNKTEAVTLIQNASNAQDPRAMRLLSKLYYKGEEGLAQNAELGKYWLEQASDAGHPEAKQVNQQMQLAQMLISERKQEEKSDKLYLYLFIGLAVLVLLIMIFL